VTVVDFWCNEFGMRARLALREKRVPFEFVEEDLRVRERSELVRRMNPVHRAIPILIHAGRPVCGSLNIVEYVDEVWTSRQLLPADPLERANARFWADFVDQKVRRTSGPGLRRRNDSIYLGLACVRIFINLSCNRCTTRRRGS
jgi:glutathione S-transferase